MQGGLTIECTISCWSRTMRWRWSAAATSAINIFKLIRSRSLRMTTYFPPARSFWNSALAIPAEALRRPHGESKARKATAGGIDYAALLANGDPYAGIMSGKLPLSWAPAQLVYDSPDKKQVVSGRVPGALIVPEVEKSIRAVKSEMLLVTPYLVPSED